MLLDDAQAHGVQVRLDAMELHRPWQWDASWLACQLYQSRRVCHHYDRTHPGRDGDDCYRSRPGLA